MIWNRLNKAAFIVLCVFVFPANAEVNHDAFRGNNSNGISTAHNLPTIWDLKNGVNIAWRRDIPRKGYNSPIINGNKLFFTGADEETRELFCYDLTTGEQLWSLKAVNISGAPLKLPDISDDAGLAASTATTNGNVVCAIFAIGDIICADMNGKQLWAKNLGLPDMNYGYSSSLLIYGNTVIVQFDDHKSPRIMALDLATGTERWSKARTEKATWSSPMIAMINDTPLLIVMGNPNMIAYNPNNGEEQWRVGGLRGEVVTSACSTNNLVFYASEGAKMVAVNGEDGKLLWQSDEYLPEIASPVATKDNLIIATTYGIVAAFCTKTGKICKEHDLMRDFNASPIIAEEKVYLFSTEGKVFILSADDEFNLLHSFETGEQTFATPAFTDGKIVVRTEKSIYCVINN
jgi:outer membrane protein assembly factor BamB